MVFPDRSTAGQMLGARLVQFANEKPLLVLALPRGGVPVAFEVATALHAPLDVFLVRKLGFPGQEELAIGAIATGGARLLNAAHHSQPPSSRPSRWKKLPSRKTKELERRQLLYRGDRETPNIQGQTVILVDDGIATGSSMRVAVTALRQESAKTDCRDSRCPGERFPATAARGRQGCLSLHTTRFLRRGRVVSRFLSGQRRHRPRPARPRRILEPWINHPSARRRFPVVA